MVDCYPSRKKTEVEILQRQDHVIHSDESKQSNCPLSQEQLDAYKQNGFLFLDGFFSEESVKSMQEEVFTLKNANKHDNRSEIIREPDSGDIRSIFAIHRDDAYFQRLALQSKLNEIASYLLGSDVYIHQSRVNYKPGFEGKEFDWHSDFETWHVEDGMPRMRAISVSISLSDNYSCNGPLMLIPGSHNYFISCLGETPDCHDKKSLKQQSAGIPDRDSLDWLVQNYGIQTPTGKAGSVLIYESNTMHGSNSNITPYDSNNLSFVYNSVENRLVAPFSGGAPRPEFIAARESELINA